MQHSSINRITYLIYECLFFVHSCSKSFLDTVVCDTLNFEDKLFERSALKFAEKV